MQTALDLKDLRGKTAVVTGAASGIGLAVATCLARCKAEVVLVDIAKDSLGHEVKSLKSDGYSVSGITTDLSSESSIRQMSERVFKRFGHADILVNNAGLQYVSPLETFPVKEWDKLINIMLRGAFLCSQQFLTGMTEVGWGRIINIASIHSVVASPFKSAYVSAKHGLLGLTKTLALEAATKGVTVNSISPAYVNTPLVERQIDSQARLHSLPKERVIKEIMLAPMPQKELIEAEEIGYSVTFLCSDVARHINGHNLVIDGGWTIN